MHFDVDKHTIFLTVHGSRAYGTNLPTSDTDIKGICIPPLDHMLGYAYNFEQVDQKEADGHPNDRVVYGIRKFFKLAADCNPNIIEVLFGAEKNIQRITQAGTYLLQHRDMFVSKKARHTFSGYAHAQLKRIKSHRDWLLNPPGEKPTRVQFGLPEGRAIGKEQLGAIASLKKEGYEFSDEAERVLSREKQYAGKLQNWKQYQSWKKNRNETRAQLERDHGYDTKHAMHLVRLMRMCTEILRGDGVKVWREDAEELLQIRAGEWDYDRLIEEAERLDSEAGELYKTSSLPHGPDVPALNQICLNTIVDYYGVHTI
jgi:predicted nucleotidyltransferase